MNLRLLILLFLPAHRCSRHSRGGIVSVDGGAVEDRIPQLLLHDRQRAVRRQLQAEETGVRHRQIPVSRGVAERLDLEALSELRGGERQAGAAPGEAQQSRALLVAELVQSLHSD